LTSGGKTNKEGNKKMNNTDNEFMGAPKYPAIKFPEVGALYQGQLIEISKRQAYDPDTDKPLTWENGDPMYVFIWKVVDKSGEIGNLWVKGHMFSALREACEAAGVTNNADLVGATVHLKHNALGEKKKPTHNPPKLFQAKVTLMDKGEQAAFIKQFTGSQQETGGGEYDPFPEG
jgi:hypothetical protein